MRSEAITYVRFFRRKDFFLYIVALISIIGLYGWYAGKLGLASYSLLYIPIAPSTAFTIFTLCIVLFWIINFDQSQFTKLIISTLLILISFYCTLIFLDFIFNFRWDAEFIFALNPKFIGNIQSGRMSPLSSLLCIFTCISILGYRQINSKIFKYIGGTAGLMIFIVSVVLLLGYLYKVPFLYGSRVIPVSLPSCICFLLLSSSLLRVYHFKFWTFNIIGENPIKHKLLKSFLPIIILIIIIQGYFIANYSLNHQHPALTSSLIILIAIFITIVVVMGLSESFGIQIQEAEFAIRKSEEKYRSVTQTANDAIITVDINGKILGWNHGAEVTFGYKEHQIIGQSLSVIIPNQYLDLHTEGMNRLKSGGEKHVVGTTTEVQGLNKNGAIFPIELSLSEWEIAEGKFYTGIIRNITERKQAELLIQLKNQELHELNVTKDKFFSIIAHDLKNPFSSLIGMSELLIKNFENFDKIKIKRIVQDFNDVANKTYELLENLLEWSKLQRGSIIPNIQEYNLKTITNSLSLLFTEMAASKNITLQNNITSDIYVWCDINMINTVFRNLISNALKFTNINGIVSISAFQRDSCIEIQVTDTGLGIPPENILFLFSIEKDISTKGTLGEKGTGLGLLLCKELIEKQKGKIWAESKLGKGSTFYFTLSLTYPATDNDLTKP